MPPFFRALRDGLRYWRVLALAIGCSAGSALLWGMNIAALFPIIEVTLHGKSLSQWNDDRRQKSEAALEQLKTQQAALAASKDSSTSEREQRAQNASQIASEIALESARLDAIRRLQPALDRYLPGQPFGTILLVAAAILAATLGKHLLGVSNQCLVGYVSASIAGDIRVKVFDKALALDRPQFHRTGCASFATYLTSVTEALASGIANFYGGAVTEPLKIIVCLGGAWFISWRLTLCSLLVAPLVAILIVWLNRRVKAILRSTMDRSMSFYHVASESLNNHLTVQAFAMEPFERDRLRASTRALMKQSMRTTFLQSLTGPIAEVLGIGMICTAVVVGSYLVIFQTTHVLGVEMTDRPLSAAALMVYFGMLIGASDPVRRLSTILGAINTGSVAAKALYDLFDSPSKIVSPEISASVARPHRKLEFRGVSFSYDGGAKVLNELNACIPFGQRIAIIGPNGGGKSTLVNLICRFYDPTEGQVLLDDVPLSQMDLRDLRSRIALVTQHTEIFNESIRHNIRYGRWAAGEHEIEEAARKAYAHEFIMQLPEKYETIAGTCGQRLSGGQRQRVVLARALLRDPEILILDEATSQIDAESERLIHASLAEFAKSRTVIMITHRESTLALADRVLEIRSGRLTEVVKAGSKAA